MTLGQFMKRMEREHRKEPFTETDRGHIRRNDRCPIEAVANCDDWYQGAARLRLSSTTRDKIVDAADNQRSANACSQSSLANLL